MNIFQEMIQAALDPGSKSSHKLKNLEVDQTIKDWQLQLSNKTDVSISSLIKNGPLILIFIRGTWCPFCQLHMKRLREWSNNLKGKKATTIVVSSESLHKIREWLSKNPFSFLFASDKDKELGQYLGVYLDGKEHFEAATYLIDTNMTIRLAYTGKRTKQNFQAMEKALTYTTS